MVRLFRCLLGLALLLSGASLCSASSADNAFIKAGNRFNSGLWEAAAADYGAFVTNHPTSFHVPAAILFQAEALIKSRHVNAGIELLSTNEHRAGEWGDRYVYWIAQGHLAISNYPAAADAFSRLAIDFPGSTNRLEACVGEAAAHAMMKNWNQVSVLLGAPESIFQQIAATITNDFIVRGYLLLGEAELAQKRFAEAIAVVRRLSEFNLKPEFAWQRWYLQSRMELADQRPEDALTSTTNLIALANATGSNRLRAESYVLIAGVLERLKRFDDAVAVHEQNLTNNVPVEQQRTALLKIAELSLAQNKSAEAIRRLEKFWSDYPKSEAADMVLLSLGELLLKQATTNRAVSSNLLEQALARFDATIQNFPKSALLGKAWLGKGWCFWYGQQFAESETAFRAAASHLPVSSDQATARFKAADAQLTLKNYEGAVTTYRELIRDYASVPEVKDQLLEQALYQTVRAALAATNLTAATEAVQQMLDWYPNGLMGDRSLLLVAESFAEERQAARARELLSDFETRFGNQASTLLPEVRLAIARSYEKEGNWSAAITNHDAWMASFTNHPKLPEVLFARAWDTGIAGDETNALTLFNSFVAQYPQHELAPRAKWWIGDHYFSQGNYGRAEENYPYTTNYFRSELYFPAHLRAGRAAMARLSYKDAISYFTNLIAHPSCPPDLKLKAAMAAGDAFMSRNEPGATNRFVDLEEASAYFNFALKSFPTNAQVAYAWIRLGDCYKEMGTSNPKFYDRAIEAYGKAITAPGSLLANQRQARIGLGIVAEAKAEARTGAEQQALRKEALGHYSDAFVEVLQANDPGDLFWFQKAGMETARMAEVLGEWPQALNIYRQIQASPHLSTAFQATLDRKIRQAREQIPSAQN